MLNLQLPTTTGKPISGTKGAKGVVLGSSASQGALVKYPASTKHQKKQIAQPMTARNNVQQMT
jgi:hypothetical protein